MAIVVPSPHGAVSPADLRPHTGRRVRVDTFDGPVWGELLSCTVRSVWLVDADDDHVVPLDEVVRVRPD